MKRYGKPFKLENDLMDNIEIYMWPKIRDELHEDLIERTNEEFLREYMKRDPDFREILAVEFNIEMTTTVKMWEYIIDMDGNTSYRDHWIERGGYEVFLEIPEKYQIAESVDGKSLLCDDKGNVIHLVEECIYFDKKAGKAFILYYDDWKRVKEYLDIWEVPESWTYRKMKEFTDFAMSGKPESEEANADYMKTQVKFDEVNPGGLMRRQDIEALTGLYYKHLGGKNNR